MSQTVNTKFSWLWMQPLFAGCDRFLCEMPSVLACSVHKYTFEMKKKKKTYLKSIYKVNYIFTTGFLQLVGNGSWFQFLHLVFVYSLAMSLLNWTSLILKTKGFTSSSTVNSYLQQPMWEVMKSHAALSDSQVVGEGLYGISPGKKSSALTITPPLAEQCREKLNSSYA